MLRDSLKDWLWDEWIPRIQVFDECINNVLLLVQQLRQSDNSTDFFPKIDVTLRQILDVPF